MTDKEIIQALECCGTATCISNSCPYEKIHDIPTCTTKLTRDALDLIKKQQAEVERLTVNMNAFGLGMKTEKERSDNARTEAIKEFADRLKAKKHECGCNFRKKPVFAVTEEKIDEAYKEMVGEDK